MVKLDSISTEQINQQTVHIDQMDTLSMLQLINREDQKVAQAVEQVLPQVAQAVDAICEKMSQGGRLVYCGCGTSGRLGILDAVECPPTFGTDPEQVVGLIAGGTGAFVKAVEGAEDDFDLGRKDLEQINFSAQDILVGIAASGRTPYVCGAMEYARSLGTTVVAVTCCPGSPVDTLADIGIAPTPGPEVITGSTRLKSGTAQKLVLNMLSTASMIKLGKVYGNLMVDVKATNQKLLARTISIVKNAVPCTEQQAQAALEQCGWWAKPAILMVKCGITARQAQELLEQANGRVARAIALFDAQGVCCS